MHEEKSKNAKNGGKKQKIPILKNLTRCHMKPHS